MLSLGISLALLQTQVGSKSPAVVQITTKNATQLLAPGINLGNTLEAIPTETSWGNPNTGDAYFAVLKRAGFKSIRIPVAWTQYSDEKHQIRNEWMQRVDTVVRQALDAGLFVMFNVHWDGGWLQPTFENRKQKEEKFRTFWKQIGTHFRGFDHRLMFAGTNEVMVDGDYGNPKPEYAEVQNGFNQIFVDTVRQTGGQNSNRYLVVQGFNTNIDITVKVNRVMPQDSVKGRLLMEVHHYSPYNFTLNENSEIWQWGKNATDPKATETWANEEHVDAQFELMKKQFIDRGIPVILGEYACGLKKKYPDMVRYQKDWNQYVTRSAYRHGLVPMLWDVGLQGGLFHRVSGKPQHPDMIQLIVNACKN